jgi:hypothetical protein
MLLGAIILIGGIVFLLQRLLKPGSSCSEVSMNVTPRELFEGESLNFEDQTTNSSLRRWDFDNGDTSSLQSGQYIYSNAGSYLIHLKVNNECEDTFRIQVKSAYVDTVEKVHVTISGPETVFVGQKYKWNGSASGAKQWKWKFGETGMVDATTQEVEYAFKYPGKNIKIILQTDVSRLPGEKYVNIVPKPVKDPVIGGPALPRHIAPSKDVIISRFNTIAIRGNPTNEDNKWISENFSNFVTTKASWNISAVKIENIDDLFSEFASNKNSYDITAIQPVIDPKTQMISSLTIKARKK